MKVITIGRSSECSIVVNDVKVSRVHAQLVQGDTGTVSVVDLGSTNGTRINGKRFTGEMRLNPGDELRVGDTVLPWQNYIATVPSQTFQPMASNTQSPATVVGEDAMGMPAGQQGKNKNTLLWIILAVVLGLLITGGVVWLLLGQGSASSGANDTIRIVDTIRNKEYENYLQSIIDEKDALINSQTQLNFKGTKSNEKSIDTLALLTDKINNANFKKIGNLYRDLGLKDHVLTCEKYKSQEIDSLNAQSWKNEIIRLYEKSNSAIKQTILNRVELALGSIKQ